MFNAELLSRNVGNMILWRFEESTIQMTTAIDTLEAISDISLYFSNIATGMRPVSR
jgi:hypothetical protein